MRRLAIVVIAIALATIAVRVAAPSSGRHVGYSAALACGVERWKVKTLQDRPRLLPARVTTVAHLVSLRRPRSLPNRRLPFERHIFSVTAAVTFLRQAVDQDLHIVLWQIGTGNHMIAEAPSSSCTRGATSYRRRQMRLARNAVRICTRARVTGVAFWDFKEGQIGVAPNAIELHPILKFVCLSS